jgi:serine phosphatase RsbU (regulator of sigma subunit)
VGLAALLAGLALARAWLPEWRPGPAPEKRSFVERYRGLAGRAGVRLPPAEPRMALTVRDKDADLNDDALDRVGPPDQAAELGAGLLVEVKQQGAEMDLLARMQLGLLPSRLPQITGWEIAARSLLATEAGGDLYDFLEDEAGRLWIAAGDVAGHGYSCSIAHAMTSASLASLIAADKTPAEVLQGVDRVIRRASTRNFTSLALVRLDPRTGEALLSNAGHPFPLLLLGVAGGVEEIDLPGLPLGQGPPRTYADLRFEIPPGSSLVFCSDGLFEAADGRDTLYGYERPRDFLRSLGDRPAAGILEALFADWRRHLGEREHQDDTTVVVVRRALVVAPHSPTLLSPKRHEGLI